MTATDPNERAKIITKNVDTVGVTDDKDKEGVAGRRKLMEHVTVQNAQYLNLYNKNLRFLQLKKEYKYYPLGRLYR